MSETADILQRHGNTQQVLKQLIEQKASAKENQAAWKTEEGRLDTEMAQIMNPAGYLAKEGKLEDGGSMTFREGFLKFNFIAEKKVKYDSKALQAIASKMPWGQVDAIFKIKFDISETIYKTLVTNAKAGMFSQDILDQINLARTVKVEPAKVKEASIIEDQL